MLNYKQNEGKKTVCDGKRNNTNSSEWGQEFATAPQHTESDTDPPAGDQSD